MRTLHRSLALVGTVALASSLVACGGGSQNVNADDTEDQSEASEGTSISSINADNVEGTCEQVFGSIEDVYNQLQLEVSEGATFGLEGDRYAEYGGWGDEYFPETDSKPATIRCVAKASHENEEGVNEGMSVDISVAAGDDDPTGNIDFTVSADGLTAGILSLTRSGSGMQSRTEAEIVDQSIGEQFITDEVLPGFTP